MRHSGLNHSSSSSTGLSDSGRCWQWVYSGCCCQEPPGGGWGTPSSGHGPCGLPLLEEEASPGENEARLVTEFSVMDQICHGRPTGQERRPTPPAILPCGWYSKACRSQGGSSSLESEEEEPVKPARP